MSSIDSILNSLGYEVDRQTRDLNRKADLTNQQWKGAARNQFDKSHIELKANADQVKREIEELKRVARSLESSIQAADRDMARKAAQVKK